MWATSHCNRYCLRRMLLSILKVSFHSEWLITCAYYRYMSRPVMSGPGLYDPTTIMNADILAYCQKEGWCKLAFSLLAFFLLPTWHDLCFGELLEQRSEELVQLSACKKPPMNGFYPARSCFQEWPMESDQLL